MNIRILLLRLFLASWAIPLSWVVILPLCVLLGGWKTGVNDTIEFNHALWNGR
jgi:hypothetical protein